MRLGSQRVEDEKCQLCSKGLMEILKVPRTSRAPREFTHTLKHPNLAPLAKGRQGRREG